MAFNSSRTTGPLLVRLFVSELTTNLYGEVQMVTTLLRYGLERHHDGDADMILAMTVWGTSSVVEHGQGSLAGTSF